MLQDRLLDMGFSKEIRKILTYLPRTEKRQTLLFSATIPRSLRESMKEIVGVDAVKVDCVNDQDTSTKINQQVEQSYIQLPDMATYISTLVAIVQDAMSVQNYKVVVFFPATKLVGFFADICKVGLGIPVLELHSKMSQSARQRASDSFRNARKGILFTSDVSARGIDYPDVSLVVQYGSADSEETYIHRLGRTGRAGKEGRGLQVLLPFEDKIVPTMKRFGIEKDDELQGTLLIPDDDTMHKLETVYRRIRNGDVVLTTATEGAYRAFLAYYISRLNSLGITAVDVVTAANQLSATAGLIEPPKLSGKIATRLELVAVPGIFISGELDDLA
jgi:ATP-dependent RNA helicase MSS116, mitochondrial